MIKVIVEYKKFAGIYRQSDLTAYGNEQMVDLVEETIKEFNRIKRSYPLYDMVVSIDMDDLQQSMRKTESHRFLFDTYDGVEMKYGKFNTISQSYEFEGEKFDDEKVMIREFKNQFKHIILTHGEKYNSH